MTESSGGDHQLGGSDFSDKRIAELLDGKEYEAASQLITRKLAKNPNDETRRQLLACLLNLNTTFDRALEVAQSIENKTSHDFGDLAYVQLCLGKFDAALDSIDKCILLQDNAWAHFFRAVVLRRGKYDYQCDEVTRKQMRTELETAISLPHCPENAYLTLVDMIPRADQPAFLEQAIASYPNYARVRLQLAEQIVWEAPGKAFMAVEPLLTAEKPKPEVLGIAVQAQIRNAQPEQALVILKRFSNEDQKKPGFSKILGDLFLALGRHDEAITEFEREIVSDHMRSRIVGLFSRAYVRLKTKEYEAAIRDAQNALNLCFEHGVFDFTTEPFWFPYLQGYGHRDTVLSVCKALDINDAKVIACCETVARWQARFLEWMQEYEIQGTEADSTRIKDFETHLSHPFVSRVLSEFYLQEGDILESVRHHLVYKRWQFAQLRTEESKKCFSAGFYLEDDALPKKTETLKIHRLVKAELQSCTSAEEVTRIFLPFYVNAWRSMLKKHELYEEIKVVTDTLLKFAPNDTEILWDFAYAFDLPPENRTT